MEGVLAVHARSRDPYRPLVCLYETSKQLLAETRATIPMKPVRPARFAYEYERNGTANHAERQLLALGQFTRSAKHRRSSDKSRPANTLYFVELPFCRN